MRPVDAREGDRRFPGAHAARNEGSKVGFFDLLYVLLLEGAKLHGGTVTTGALDLVAGEDRSVGTE